MLRTSAEKYQIILLPKCRFSHEWSEIEWISSAKTKSGTQWNSETSIKIQIFKKMYILGKDIHWKHGVLSMFFNNERTFSSLGQVCWLSVHEYTFESLFNYKIVHQPHYLHSIQSNIGFYFIFQQSRFMALVGTLQEA